MRRTIVMLTFALVLPAIAGAADPATTPSARPATLTTSGQGPLAAAARDAARTLPRADRATPRSNFSINPQAVEERGHRRSWIGRHPALFGTLVGAGSGALIGSFAGHEDTEEWMTQRASFVLFGASAGAAGGAIVGWIAGMVRN